jgi:hypothetical protein
MSLDKMTVQRFHISKHTLLTCPKSVKIHVTIWVFVFLEVMTTELAARRNKALVIVKEST